MMQRESSAAAPMPSALRRLLHAADQGEPARYAGFHRAGPNERMQWVRDGVPARLLTRLAADLDVPREQVFAWTSIARATANRKLQADAALALEEGERTLALAALIGQVEEIVTQSGELEHFMAGRWLAAWLSEPNDALGNRCPGDHLDTEAGRAVVAQLVGQMQSGAYA